MFPPPKKIRKSSFHNSSNPWQPGCLSSPYLILNFAHFFSFHISMWGDSHIFPFYVNLSAQMANRPREARANPRTLCWLLKAYFWAALRWWGGQVHNFPIALFYVRLTGCPFVRPAVPLLPYNVNNNIATRDLESVSKFHYFILICKKGNAALWGLSRHFDIFSFSFTFTFSFRRLP